MTTTQEELAGLRATVQQLADREAIRDVLYRYCRAVDRGDWDIMHDVFHDDAIDEHGAYVGGIPGFIAFLEQNFAEATAFDGTITESLTHSIGSMIIDLRGDIADVESYFYCIPVSRENPATGKRTIGELYGRYVDRLEKRDGVWRIAHRLVVKDLRDVHEVTFNPVELYVSGEHGKHDPSYTRAGAR